MADGGEEGGSGRRSVMPEGGSRQWKCRQAGREANTGKEAAGEMEGLRLKRKADDRVASQGSVAGRPERKRDGGSGRGRRRRKKRGGRRDLVVRTYVGRWRDRGGAGGRGSGVWWQGKSWWSGGGRRRPAADLLGMELWRRGKAAGWKGAGMEEAMEEAGLDVRLVGWEGASTEGRGTEVQLQGLDGDFGRRKEEADSRDVGWRRLAAGRQRLRLTQGRRDRQGGGGFR